ncbi:MAG: photosynthetic reaction center cytochrome c subunit [Rhodobacteraceae bacterium]|nr:photosynthetic reaction center cytochrome c subunit [Paracoccaceae bacterium]
MRPKWYDQWNKDNPTGLKGLVILLGTTGAAIFAAILVIGLGQPFPTHSMQTGPRGTAMYVPEFAADLRTGDPTVADYYTDEPFVPEPGEDLAGDIYENVQVLGGLTDANFNRLMNAMTLWVAPDQGCAYCHAGAAEGEYASDDLYTKIVARSMLQMTQNINQNWDIHVNANTQIGVTCYTCHRGRNVPNNIWFRISPVNEAMAGWSANQNRVTMTSNFTSLPSDYLETYLLDYERISVHDLEPRVQNLPGDPLIQQAERTYAFMNYISNSLGVNCTFCHNSRAFYDGAQVTPQWSTASLGIQMVQELNEVYLIPLGDVYPPKRLGPVHADPPLVACRTCHQGYQRPMEGLNVIQNWPELASTSGEYDYSAFNEVAPE